MRASARRLPRGALGGFCRGVLCAHALLRADVHGAEEIIRDVTVYGRIVCVFSFGLFLESVWTKILQANGDMKTPMVAQLLGAVTNILLDPILIFGRFGLPETGIAGAAVATVAGQVVAALVVLRKGFRKSPALRRYPGCIAGIFRLGVPNILMQSAYTFYILGLNLILATFCDEAVTALGLYYKWQTFFFIPLGAMQTCMVPIVSYNYAAGKLARCRKTLSTAVLFGLALKPSEPGVLLTIAREHGSSGKQIGQERPITGTSRESAGEIRKTTSWWWIPRWGWRRRQRRFWSFSLPTAGRSRRKRRDGTSSRRKSNKKAGGSQPGEGSVLPASVLKKISGPRKERQRRLRAGGHPRRCRKWACRRGFRAEEQARFRFCTPA